MTPKRKHPYEAEEEGLAPGTDVDYVTGARVDRDDSYESGFGIGLAHDGEADNALVPGLNLGLEYRQMEADFSRSEIEASADMDLDVAFVSLTPYVSFVNRSDADVDSGSFDRTTIQVGTGLETEALDVFFSPSLLAAVNYRNASYSDDFRTANEDEWTAEEFQWSVGLVLNEFLFENSSFTAKYGSWTGTNVNNDLEGDDIATNISDGDDNNDVTQYTTGYELIWDYYGLQLAYGVYSGSYDDSVDANDFSGQAFSISYEVEF